MASDIITGRADEVSDILYKTDIHIVQIHVMALLCRAFKEFFSDPAVGTEPGIGEVLERGARIDSMLRIAHNGIINVAACCAFPFCHDMPSFT